MLLSHQGWLYLVMHNDGSSAILLIIIYLILETPDTMRGCRLKWGKWLH